jgi:hypothetical protein
MPAVTKTPAVVRANGDESRAMVIYGWFSFRRTGAFIPFKGMLAYDFLTLVALDPDVFDISKRVRIIPWYDGKQWQQHAPRYAIHRRQCATAPVTVSYVDVLWSRERKANAPKFERLEREAVANNIDYRWFTEQEVRVNPRLLNAKIVQKFADAKVISRSALEAIRDFADERDSFSVSEAVSAGVADYADAYGASLHFVGTGRLTFPLGRRFDADSRITRRRV